jgi:hypothetical protein
LRVLITAVFIDLFFLGCTSDISFRSVFLGCEFNKVPSVAIYELVGHDQRVRGEDLRGRTWERAFLPDARVVFVGLSDGPLSLNGTDWIVPDGVPPREKTLREFTKISWKHFIAHYGTMRWFLRGLYDMYVNVTNLMAMIGALEREFDPMVEWVSRYGCHCYGGIDYPHGSTGHLFSNFAVRRLITNIPFFDECPKHWCEDRCVRFTMDKMDIPFYGGCSVQFIITFPAAISQRFRVMPCPQFSSFGGCLSLLAIPPTPISTAVTAHMHRIPMQLWTAALLLARNFSIVWLDGGPVFCNPG